MSWRSAGISRSDPAAAPKTRAFGAVEHMVTRFRRDPFSRPTRHCPSGPSDARSSRRSQRKNRGRREAAAHHLQHFSYLLGRRFMVLHQLHDLIADGKEAVHPCLPTRTRRRKRFDHVRVEPKLDRHLCHVRFWPAPGSRQSRIHRGGRTSDAGRARAKSSSVHSELSGLPRCLPVGDLRPGRSTEVGTGLISAISLPFGPVLHVSS